MSASNLILNIFGGIVLLSLMVLLVGSYRIAKSGTNKVSLFLDLLWTIIPYIIIFVLLLPNLRGAW